MTQIRDVLHLYLGSEVRYLHSPSKRLDTVLNPYFLHRFLYGDLKDREVQLLLRPLVAAWLLRESFDLFDLIESGQAIDKSKLQSLKQ